MHILFISPFTTKLTQLEHLQDLSDIVVHYQATFEHHANNITQDIIFFDASLGEENIIRYIHHHQPDHFHPWLVINFESNVRQALQYLQAGATGILTKNCHPEKLQQIIQSSAKGQLYLEDNLTQALAMRQIKKILTPFSQLSAREFDVFCLLAEGFSIAYISEALSISTKTTFNCQTQVRHKLNLKNQQQITEFAKSRCLIL